MQMLASDLNNPEFVGAQNPDRLLHVEFYMHEPEDGNKPWVKGKPVRMPAIPYVRIQRPGDNTSIVETPVREDHKARFPDRWMFFQIQQGEMEGDGEIPGWKVEDWGYLDKDRVHELKYLRFYTVEQIAGASDAQVQRLGLGGLGLREEARRALSAKAGSGIREEIARKDAEIDALKKADAEKEARLAKLEALLLTPQAPVAPQPPADNAHVAAGSERFPEAKKRGRVKGSKNKPKELQVSG